jgi:hypothetical protein
VTPGVCAPLSCSTFRGAAVLSTSLALMVSMTLPDRSLRHRKVRCERLPGDDGDRAERVSTREE